MQVVHHSGKASHVFRSDHHHAVSSKEDWSYKIHSYVWIKLPWNIYVSSITPFNKVLFIIPLFTDHLIIYIYKTLITRVFSINASSQKTRSFISSFCFPLPPVIRSGLHASWRGKNRQRIRLIFFRSPTGNRDGQLPSFVARVKVKRNQSDFSAVQLDR